jgi:hypothetical protein
MKKFVIILLALTGVTQLHAQFVIGWSGGWAPARELNREIYVYNAVNSALTEKMGAVHWYQGPVIGFRSGTDDGPFVELLYQRKRVKVGSEWDSSGVTMTREMKTLCNTFNLGFGFQTGGWRIGFSFDAGRFKGFGRRGAKDGIDDTAWERIWVKDNSRILFISKRLYIAETIFVERQFGFLCLRAYCQLPGIRAEMDRLDEWMFGNDINFAQNQSQAFWNFGMSLTVALGGK